MFRICLAVAAVSTCVFAVTAAQERQGSATPRGSRIPVGGAELYSREIGHGTAIIVLHGGPDFDHSYLVPDLDRLADSYRLICYDQRGRGRSADGVKPEDVTLASDIADIKDCGHFTYMECPAAVREQIDAFFRGK